MPQTASQPVLHPPPQPSPGTILGGNSWEPESTPLTRSDDIFSMDPFHLTDDLYHFFGFIHGRSFETTFEPATNLQCSHVAGIVGHRKVATQFEGTPLMRHCLNFVDGFKNQGTPANHLFDLADHSKSVRHSPRFSCLQRIHTTPLLAILLPAEKRMALWFPVLFNAVDALFVCRLPPASTDVEITRILVERGIRFHTFMESKSRNFTLPPSPLVPIRLSDYKFERRDYLAYLEEREILFLDAWVSCAALKMGGITWRIAREHANMLDVLDGPTTAVTIRNVGESMPGSSADTMLCDDVLSDGEKGRICGLVHQYTGTLMKFFTLYYHLHSFRTKCSNEESFMVANGRDMAKECCSYVLD